MNETLIFGTLLAGTFSVVLIPLFRKLAAKAETLPVSTDWIQDLSAGRYRPMERLLGSEDYEFLVSQPGVDRRTARRFRRERRELFRRYLDGLKGDFGRVCLALEIMMIQSAHDRPELSLLLIRQKAMFRAGLLRLELRLALHATGWDQVVDMRYLGSALDTLSYELRRMLPSPPQPLHQPIT